MITEKGMGWCAHKYCADKKKRSDNKHEDEDGSMHGWMDGSMDGEQTMKSVRDSRTIQRQQKQQTFHSFRAHTNRRCR